jgi:hypothetical protein
MGDRLCVDLDEDGTDLLFLKEAEGLSMSSLRMSSGYGDDQVAAAASARESTESVFKPVVARSRK